MSGEGPSGRIPAPLNLRYWEIAGAAVLAAAAALMGWQAIVAGPGWRGGQPDAGFFPFWVSAIMLVCSLVALAQAARRARPGWAVERNAVGDVLRVGVPMAVAMVASVYVVGFYPTSGLYVAIFSRWYGRHSWALSLGVGLALAVGMFFLFEKYLRLPMPKSALYGDFVPF